MSKNEVIEAFASMEDSWVVGTRVHMSIWTMLSISAWAAALSFWWLVTGFVTHKFVLGLLSSPPYGTIAAFVATPMYVFTISLAWVWAFSAIGLPGGDRTIVDH